MTEPQEPVGITRKPRRRWRQISLRTLLLLITLFGVGLGWFVNRGERQRRAVAALKEIGGIILYYDSRLPSARKFLELSRWLPRDYFDDVGAVILSDRNVTDADMVHLKVFTRLQRLELNDTQVTDGGLAHIEELNQIRSLFLADTQVTDAGLAQIQEMNRLRWLTLDRTQVSDAGLPQLKGLTCLRVLTLYEAQVTDAGAAMLQSRLPNCRIEN